MKDGGGDRQHQYKDTGRKKIKSVSYCSPITASPPSKIHTHHAGQHQHTAKIIPNNINKEEKHLQFYNCIKYLIIIEVICLNMYLIKIILNPT